MFTMSCLLQITVTPLGALSRTEPDAIPYFKACVSRLVGNFASLGCSFPRSRVALAENISKAV
jgi:5'-nucleotidase